MRRVVEMVLIVGGMLMLGASTLCAATNTIDYVPTCRLLDTRNGSPLTAGTTYTVTVRGASGCTLPFIASGAVINLSVVTPDSDGWIKLWDFDSSEPTTASEVYSQSDTATNDGMIVKLGNTGDLKLKLGFGTAHVVIDLVGGTFNTSFLAFAGAPPSSPSAGDIYIVRGGTGVFLNQDNAFARWSGVAWNFVLPEDGDTSHNLAIDRTYQYSLDLDIWAPSSGATLTFQGEIITNDPIGDHRGIWIDSEPLMLVCGEPYATAVECSDESLAVGNRLWGTGYIDGDEIRATRIEPLPVN